MTAQTFPTGSSARDDQTIPKKIVWTGRILSGLAALFLLVDGGMKLWKPAVVVEATRQLGYAESQITGIGVALLACTLLYVSLAHRFSVRFCSRDTWVERSRAKSESGLDGLM
jgi:hypothetical protein